ncbi:NADH pyrophosphatase [Aureococcus anophagefferens]|nr:NADH pyrophosphatase [Aureococcus anophagefferens]
MSWFCADKAREHPLALFFCGRSAPEGLAGGGSGVREICEREEMERKVLKPRFTLAEAKAMARDEFHVRVAAIVELNSYDDQNYKVTAEDGAVYVLKVHNGVESRDEGLLDAQSQLYERLRRKGVAAPYPVDSVRFWVDGDLLSSKEITPGLLATTGAFLGRIRLALDDFDHAALHRVHLWDGRQFPALASFADGLVDAGCDVDKAADVHQAIANFDAVVAPAAAQLPLATLHGDFNDANVLVGAETLGVLDIGDSVHSWRVNDVAVGMAYVVVTLCTPENARSGFDASSTVPEAIQGALAFVDGLRGVFDLTPPELEALPHLAACRLATSFTLGYVSYQESLKLNPDMPQEKRDYLLHHALPAATWRSSPTRSSTTRARASSARRARPSTSSAPTRPTTTTTAPPAPRDAPAEAPAAAEPAVEAAAVEAAAVESAAAEAPAAEAPAAEAPSGGLSDDEAPEPDEAPAVTVELSSLPPPAELDVSHMRPVGAGADAGDVDFEKYASGSEPERSVDFDALASDGEDPPDAAPDVPLMNTSMRTVEYVPPPPPADDGEPEYVLPEPPRAPKSADAIAAVLGAMDARLHGDAGDILDSCKSVMRIFKISDPATVDRVQAADGDVQAAYAALEAATNAARGSLQKRLDEATAAINAAVVSAHAAKHAVDVAPHDDF